MMVIFVFILGLIFGSFINAVIFRLKSGKQFICGHSKCLSCKHNLAFLDLIPIISFVFLRAKCRYCQAKISWQYPLVELAAALAFLIGYFHYSALDDYLVYLVFSCFLIVIFVFDLKYYLILDKVSLSALVVAFALNFLLGHSAVNLLIGAFVISGFFLLQFALSKGKWIGGGDLRLGLVIGAMLGWPFALVALSLAYISGAALGLVLIVLKKKRFSSQLPFGAFLSLATWVTLLWGEKILNWYLDTML